MATNVIFAVVIVIIVILLRILDVGLKIISGGREHQYGYQSSVGERRGNKLYSEKSSIGLTRSNFVMSRPGNIRGGCDPRDIDQITATITEASANGRKINLTETFLKIVLGNAMGLPFASLETHDPLPQQLYPMLKSHLTAEYPDAASYNAALAQQLELMSSADKAQQKAARAKYATMAHLTLDGLAMYPDGRVAAAFEYNGAVHYNVQSGDAAKYRHNRNGRALLRDAIAANNRDQAKNYILQVLQIPYIRIHYLVPTELLCDYAVSRLADLRLLNNFANTSQNSVNTSQNGANNFTYVPAIPEPVHQRPFDMCLVLSSRATELYQHIVTSGQLTTDMENTYCDIDPEYIEQGIVNVSGNRERMNREQIQAWFAHSPAWQYYLSVAQLQQQPKKTLKNVIAEAPPRRVQSRADVRAAVAAALPKVYATSQ